MAQINDTQLNLDAKIIKEREGLNPVKEQIEQLNEKLEELEMRIILMNEESEEESAGNDDDDDEDENAENLNKNSEPIDIEEIENKTDVKACSHGSSINDVEEFQQDEYAPDKVIEGLSSKKDN